ncbi:cytidine deaminase [Acidithiobacillus acidisediminis]|uniref:cytidine deaminase n=1 Tax=Acidithiobacillus TaxID=119977 RepID=UPI00200EE735|nr:cytidine deaminase [Acidithiobacillus sp. S30A2]MCL5051965.1 cytidine deaminase [Gammaproteobacteria bacterium]
MTRAPSPAGPLSPVAPEQLIALRRAASQALERAYAPYSRYRVGAALLTKTGDIVPGANVENAAYPSGLCAEASAIGHLVATLGVMPLRAAFIVCQGDKPAWPCGSCRQRLNEFALPELWIFTATWEGPVEGAAFSSLFPHSFGPQNLGRAELGQ